MAHLIAALVEMDTRRLYLGQGCSSLFTYCTQVLHLSEQAAYGRIEAARVVRKFPVVLDLLAAGSVHLTAIGLLAPHLTEDNHEKVLAAAQHKSKREVEELVASLRPQPPVPSTIRKLPTPRPGPARRETSVDRTDRVTCMGSEERKTNPAVAPPAQRPRAEMKPLAPEYYKVQFTASRATRDKLRQAQHLLRHSIPDGDVAAVVDRALTVLIATLQKVKHAATAPPRTSAAASSKGRYISAAVRREVWKRDGAQCAFVGPAGRCTERGFLEFHHVVPYADGGGKTVPNIELRCRAHNGYEAERWFGTGGDLLREESVPYSVRCQPLGRNYLAELLGPDRAGMKYPKLAGQPVWSFDDRRVAINPRACNKTLTGANGCRASPH
jgi:5-methylcytosine-specific restriction endonuclease McrA